MFFGRIDTVAAVGAILAHSVKIDGRTFKKGRRLAQQDVDDLFAANVDSVTAARLADTDVHEDAAAEQLGSELAGVNVSAKAPFTGRVNLYAQCEGLLRFDPELVHTINRVDESITVATLAPWTWVKPRQMVATIKIIPFAVAAADLSQAQKLIAERAFAVSPMCAKTAVLIQTQLPSVRESVLDKTVRVLDARLAAIGVRLVRDLRVPHTVADTAAAIDEFSGDADMVLIAGASAIVDRRDVIPSAIVAAGGEVLHFGMPVDPGNLILLARRGGATVLGLPGCARSPALNGVDLVLQRLATNEPIDAQTIMRMGVGGLLKEFAGRPTPRSGTRPTEVATVPSIAGVVLAGGQSRRMGEVNKLLVEVDGQAMVVTAVRQAIAAGLNPVIVVTGHERERIETALDDLSVTFVHNPAYNQGLSTSLARGISAVPASSDAALVCLADMPRVNARVLERVTAAYDPLEGRSICVPTWHGKRGNPILWDKRYFAQIAEVSGDIGARHLLGEFQDQIAEVALEDACVLNDIDSPADLDALLKADANQLAEPT